MLLHTLSDLHIESGGFILPETDADVLVLAGNIGPGPGGLGWLRGQRHDRPVVYVPGMLEFSTGGFDVFDDLVSAMDTNVLLLHDDAVVVDGVRFIGSLLWTDSTLLAEAARCFSTRPVAQARFNADLLHKDLHITTPADSRQLHRQSRERLLEMLAVPFPGETVVVTTHGLSSASLIPPFANHLFSRDFIREFEPMLASEPIALWVYGQMEEAFDIPMAGCRMVSNPAGGGPEGSATGFKPGLVVEV